MSLSDQEADLFRRWSEHRPQLVTDGAVDGAAYEASSLRVVLVLKDVNSEGVGNWDLRHELRTNPMPATWCTVARWMWGIRRLQEDLAWDVVGYTPDLQQRIDAVRSLCVVNLKKEPGAAVSDRGAVARYAREDADLLREQLALYAPDVVICGGVGELVREVTGAGPWRRTRRGVAHSASPTGGVLVSYYHPQARFDGPMMYYTLVDAVRELVP